LHSLFAPSYTLIERLYANFGFAKMKLYPKMLSFSLKIKRNSQIARKAFKFAPFLLNFHAQKA